MDKIDEMENAEIFTSSVRQTIPNHSTCSSLLHSFVSNLHSLDRSNIFELVTFMIEQGGADANVVNAEGESPLVSCFSEDDVELLKLLVGLGTDPSSIRD